jgi:BirA family biotin operon repressor/biotin-[acetyl-CoA-carboxylase] ligase
VAIVDAGVTIERGIAAGVDDSGALLLDRPGGRVAIVAGDVSLRPQE